VTDFTLNKNEKEKTKRPVTVRQVDRERERTRGRCKDECMLLVRVPFINTFIHSQARFRAPDTDSHQEHTPTLKRGERAAHVASSMGVGPPRQHASRGAGYSLGIVTQSPRYTLQRQYDIVAFS